jgi:hypothetical protein
MPRKHPCPGVGGRKQEIYGALLDHAEVSPDSKLEKTAHSRKICTPAS